MIELELMRNCILSKKNSWQHFELFEIFTHTDRQEHPLTCGLKKEGDEASKNNLNFEFEEFLHRICFQKKISFLDPHFDLHQSLDNYADWPELYFWDIYNFFVKRVIRIFI